MIRIKVDPRDAPACQYLQRFEKEDESRLHPPINLTVENIKGPQLIGSPRKTTAKLKAPLLVDNLPGSGKRGSGGERGVRPELYNLTGRERGGEGGGTRGDGGGGRRGGEVPENRTKRRLWRRKGSILPASTGDSGDNFSASI